MDRIVVEPNGPLSGTVRTGGAKNSALKLMVACLLSEGRTVLSNVPRIADVDTMAEVLRAVGAEVERLDDGDLVVTTPPADTLVPVAPYELVERMRASVVVLGLLLARCGVVRMPLPGGDDFGDRPIDFHVNGLSAMGRASSLPTARCAVRCPRGGWWGRGSCWSTPATRRPTTS